MFFGTFREHHTCLYTYRILNIKHLDTILCYSEEIAKYVPIVVKLCYCHCRCCSRSGCHQRLYRYEQRGAGRQEEDHDDCRSVYLPRGSSTGIASVLRCD